MIISHITKNNYIIYIDNISNNLYTLKVRDCIGVKCVELYLSLRNLCGLFVYSDDSIDNAEKSRDIIIKSSVYETYCINFDYYDEIDIRMNIGKYYMSDVYNKIVTLVFDQESLIDFTNLIYDTYIRFNSEINFDKEIKFYNEYIDEVI